ncbi:hypothetical protein KCP69_20940 [Salmonella enterica subsp. enterica]|nr:hypothetical protein KCP69_20940 [Salmonella enterica subsp. enterica]
MPSRINGTASGWCGEDSVYHQINEFTSLLLPPLWKGDDTGTERPGACGAATINFELAAKSGRQSEINVTAIPITQPTDPRKNTVETIIVRICAVARSR